MNEPRNQQTRTELLFRTWADAAPALRDEYWARWKREEPEGVVAALKTQIEARGDAIPAADEILADHDQKRPAPARVGPYLIGEKLGEGGMGVVYAARHENLGRLVAIKLLRPNLAPDESAGRRFLAEARALARLDHPGIARIIDAGVARDARELPWIAMELLRGRPLLDAVKASNFSFDERVELIALVLDALDHAHQRGVLHRDLKSSNILVLEDRTPKILDFGLALLEEEGGATAMTRSRAAPLGSLQTMSPEQAAGDQGRIGPASDLYAVGALCFEALAGEPPIAIVGLSLTGALRRVIEQPCQRLRALVPEASADLDVILARALEKEPERRFQSASDFAADLRRYLRGEPIQSRPPSLVRSLKSFERRHRALVRTAAAGLFSLIVGTAVALRYAVIADQSRGEAVKARAVAAAEAETARLESRTARSLLRFLEQALSELDPRHAATADPTLAQALDSVAARLPEIASEPLVRTRIQSMVGAIYSSLGRYDASVPLLKEALAGAIAIKASPERRIDIATSLSWQAMNLGQLDVAREALQEAKAVRAEGHEATPRVDALILRVEGELAYHAGELEPAKAALNGALKLLDSPDLRNQEAAAAVEVTLASIALEERDFKQALAFNEAALVRRRAYLPERHPYIAESLHNIALCFYRLNKKEKVLDLLGEANAMRLAVMPPDHPAVLKGRFMEAAVCSELGELNRAVTCFEQIAPYWERLVPNHRDTRWSEFYWMMGRAYIAVGEAKKAGAAIEIAMSSLEPPDPENFLWYIRILADSLSISFALNQDEVALRRIHSALQDPKINATEFAEDRANLRIWRAEFLMRGEYDSQDLLPSIREALSLKLEALPESNRHYCFGRANAVLGLLESDRKAAMEALERAAEHFETLIQMKRYPDSRSRVKKIYERLIALADSNADATKVTRWHEALRAHKNMESK